MKSLLGRDFCFWMVSPKDGKVRKLRLSFSKILGVCLGLCFLASLFVFVASDYGRMQLLRLRHNISIQQVTSERDSLRHSNAVLNTEVNEMRSETSRVLSYEQAVKNRLNELTEALETASELGVVPEESLGKIVEPDAAKGVGGAELDCVATDGSCADMSRSMFSFSSWFPSNQRQAPDSEDGNMSLVATLDSMISIIKKVPLGNPTVGHISSAYGRRRSPFSGRWKMHQGIDFSMPHGSEVKATADGVVKSVKRNSTYGLVVDISHGDGIVTRYAHLSKAFVKKGQKVCRAQSIALVGSSGRSTGPHLHYEVLVNGKSKDPRQLLNLGRKLLSAFAS